MIDRLQVGCASKVHTLQPVFYLLCPAGPILQYGSRRSNPYLGGIETHICHMADGGFGVAEAVLPAKKTPPALPGVFAYALRP